MTTAADIHRLARTALGIESLRPGQEEAVASVVDGEILRYEGDTVTVFFDGEGYKTLAVPPVVENHLLREAAR